MSNKKYTIKGKEFYNEGKSTSYLKLNTEVHSNEWDKKQEAAIDEYVEEIEHADMQVDEACQNFEDFIVRNIFGSTNKLILDVGCGIDPNYPKYVKVFDQKMDASNNVYIGLDPISYNDEQRKYTFVCGRIEDFANVIESKFDVFIFSTCLDHFESIEAAAKAVKKIAAPNAICLFWVGLHDTALIAEQKGAQLIPALFKKPDMTYFIMNYISVCINLFKSFFYFKKRTQRLNNNQPLDKFHFYYFTQGTLKKYLSLFGKITDERRVLGTNGVFYSVAVE